MDQEIKQSEHQVRKEIARAIFKNEEGKLLSYPYCHQDIQYVGKIVNLSEEETRTILQNLILEQWHDSLFKNIENFFEGSNQLWTWFESAEDEEDIIPATIFNPWFKGHLQNFLSRFDKEFKSHDDCSDENTVTP